MTRGEILRSLDELLEKDRGTLQGSEQLEAVGWDSLSTISFMALADELGCVVNPSAIDSCVTVNDVVALVATQLDRVPAQLAGERLA
ncbi:MAG: acyl carrier protein [Acidobacteriia bacterium]|nr:acyl carrier protein [Terriglobia bacterium]